MSEGYSFDADLCAARRDLHRFALCLTNNKAEAEDLVSETMIKALGARDRFQPGTNMRAWTSFILRNLFLSQMRRSRWAGGSVDDLPITLLPSGAAPQGAVIDLADALKALAMLPKDQMNAIAIVGAGATYEEAAQELCCSVGTVKSRVARGRHSLAELLA